MSQFDVESLQETLCVQQQLIEKLYNELDEESEASASAATEALSMILRLQGEKAAEEMEAEQYKRFVEEKMSHAEESLSILQELIDQKQMEIDELDYHAQAYRCKLVSMGYDDDDDDDVDASVIEFLKNSEGKMIVQSIGRCKSTPNIPLKYANMKKGILKDEKISPKRDLNDVSTVGSINLYCEQIEKLEERVKQIAGSNYAKLSSLPASKRNSCNNFLEQFKETYLIQHRGNKSDNEAAASRSASPPNVLDVFEVPRAINDEDFVVPKEAEKQLVKDETDWHKKYLVPMQHLEICPTTSASETAEICRVNRTTFEIVEVERQDTRQEPERHEELMLRDIKEQPNLVPMQNLEICPATSASETEEIHCVNRTTFKIAEVERQDPRQEPDRHEELMLLHEIKEHLNLAPIKHLKICPMASASETAEIRCINRSMFKIAEVERQGTRQQPNRHEELMLLHDIKEQLNLAPIKHLKICPMSSASETAEIRHVNKTFEIAEVERQGVRQEPERHKQLMLLHDIKEQLNLVPMQNENKLHRVDEAASPTTSASETAEIHRVNRTTFEIAEVERQCMRQESNRHEELTLLHEIKEQLNLMQSDIKTWKNIKSLPRDEPSLVSLAELFSFFLPMSTNSSDNVVHLDEVIVAMVPFPDFSHLNQLFVLARFVASHNIPVHFLCLADRNQDLKLRVQDGLWASNIHFHDLLVPCSLAEIEDAGNGLSSIVIFMKKLVEPIRRTCIDISTTAKRLVIIHDSIMMDHLRDVHSLIPNMESYMFHCISAFARYSMLRQSIDHIVDDDHDHEKMIKQMHDEFPLLESCSGPYAAAFVRKEHEWKLNSGEIMNSCREVESKYLNLLAHTKDKQWWAVGPLHMLLESHNSSNMTSHECLQFLDKQDINSVIFVSFGTTTTFSQKQVNELGLGLEQSNHKFIWVLREADKKMETEKFEEKDEKIELPKGFEERVEGRGMVVRNWVPQLEILGHKSIGGFLSHCGWNSCLESISMGVPLAAWPINHDQPFNAILVTNFLKIGTSVRSWACREELVTTSNIEKAVKTLMGTTEGEEIRQRAVELSNKIKSSISRRGPARKEMESFISRIIK